MSLMFLGYLKYLWGLETKTHNRKMQVEGRLAPKQTRQVGKHPVKKWPSMAKHPTNLKTENVSQHSTWLREPNPSVL